MNKGTQSGTNNDTNPTTNDVNTFVGQTSDILGVKKLFLDGVTPTNKQITALNKETLATYAKNELVYSISERATSWVTQTSTFGTSVISTVAYGNNTWVAAGQGGALRTSTDAVTWVTQTSEFGALNINSVTHNNLSGANALWVAVGLSGNLRTSTDAVTWVTQTSQFGATTIRSIAYGNSLWVAGGDGGTLRTLSDSSIDKTNYYTRAQSSNLTIGYAL